MAKITQELGRDDKPESFFSMAISHHGIVQGGKNVIQMDNWDDVGKQWFNAHKIKLWFFGHYHKNSAYKFSEKPFNKENLGIVQAATLKISPGESNRGFSLIELERSDGMVKTAKEYFYKLDENGVSSTKPEPEIIF